MSRAHFEHYVDDAGEHRMRLRADNGEIVAVSEGYSTEQAAEHGAHAICRAADEARGIQSPSEFRLRIEVK